MTSNAFESASNLISDHARAATCFGWKSTLRQAAYVRTLLFFVCLLTTGTSVAQLGENPAPEIDAPTWLSFVSEEGDRIGLGHTVVFTEETGYFAHDSSPWSLWMVFRSQHLSPYFSLLMSPLEVGSYNTESSGNLEFVYSGSSLISSNAVSQFDVLEAEFNDKGMATRLAVDFEQQFSPGEPTLYGKFRYTKPAPLENTAPEGDGPTWISFTSLPGTVGNGSEKLFTPENSNISLNSWFGRYDFRIFEGNTLWNVEFAPADGEQLQAGWYTDVPIVSFGSEEEGFRFSGGGSSPGQKVISHFEVLHVEYDEAGEIESFAANFEQRGRSGDTPVLGKVRFNYEEMMCFVGDFNCDSVLDANDIDALTNIIQAQSYDATFDLTNDGLVEYADHLHLITETLGTLIGDANLDHQVDFADSLLLSANFSMPGGWSDGDFNADGNVDFADFLLLSTNFGQSATLASTAPEPSANVVGILGLLLMLLYQRQATSRC